MPKATLRDIALRGKRLFIRVDFNVPLSKAGEVTDDTRIRAVLPTLTYALQENASVILASHLGRPRGKVDPAYSLRPVAARLQELLGKPVRLAADCVGADTEALAQALKLSFTDESVDANQQSFNLIAAKVTEGATPPLEQNMALVELNRLKSMRETVAAKIEISLLELRNCG